jgi:hypothetical protein
VIVRRSERRKQQSRKDKQVWPSLPVIEKRFGIVAGTGPQQEHQAPNSNHCEGQVGHHIAKIGNPKETSPVRELVIRQLRNPRHHAANHDDRSGENHQ